MSEAEKKAYLEKKQSDGLQKRREISEMAKAVSRGVEAAFRKKCRYFRDTKTLRLRLS